jgi:NAD(P)-dependent dehydrogenase (short-subunit alcohol dehydrogenase family)
LTTCVSRLCSAAKHIGEQNAIFGQVRAGRLEDIAAAIAFRASDDPAFVLDAHILVNGNLTNDTRARWAPAQPSIFAAREAFG